MKLLRHAFTLIELLTVISILTLLVGILLPVTAKARQKARMTECMGQERQLGIAVNGFANDHDDALPTCARLYATTTPELPSLRQALSDYLSDDAVFHCPADNGSECLFDDCGTSYEWNTFLNAKKIDRATMRVAGLSIKAPMCGDAEAFHGKLGRNYLYLDGRVTQSLELLFGGP